MDCPEGTRVLRGFSFPLPVGRGLVAEGAMQPGALRGMVTNIVIVAFTVDLLRERGEGLRGGEGMPAAGASR